MKSIVQQRKEIHDRLIKIYELYPKKMGKSAGLRSAIMQCKTMDAADLLETAIHNYTAHLIREGTEKQYILYFSTFMSQWRDWLEEETGTVVKLRKKTDLSGLGFE